MVKFSNIKVVFGLNTPLENFALNGVDLDIKNGEFLTVIGSNGAGKSTLLNAIAGYVPLHSGKIEIDGKDISKLAVHERLRVMGRVFQDPLAGTCDRLTIEENMALAAKRGKSRSYFKSGVDSDNKEEFKKILKRLDLGLENRLEDIIGLLSGGQRQAVSLLMATLSPMKILLLDEHTAALDPKTQEFVMRLTQEIIEEFSLTTIMITHSMKQALEYGNRMIMLHQGRIAFDLNKEEKKGKTVNDLLDYFTQLKGEKIEDDALLLD